MKQAELSEIRRLPLFRSMTEANFLAVTRAAYDQTFPPQVKLIDEGGSADFLHIVMEGSVELFANWAEHETTLAVVRPVTSFILAACIKDVPYLMAARTLEKTRVILLPSVDLRAIFHVDPEFALATIGELAERYRSVVRHTKDLKLRNARERLAAYILRQARDGAGAASFILPVEKRLLASYLGITPESLSRTMKGLQEYGAKIDGQRVIITNRAALERLAQPSTLIDGPDDEGLAANVNPEARTAGEK